MWATTLFSIQCEIDGARRGPKVNAWSPPFLEGGDARTMVEVKVESKG